MGSEMCIRDRSSNSQKICESAKQEGCLDKDNIVKILGIRWNNKNDTVSFQNTITNDEQRCITKRNILRESSKIFDPMGMLSPVTVRAKLLMHKLWTPKFE